MPDIKLFDCKTLTRLIEDSSLLDNSIIDIIKKHTDLFFNITLIEDGYTIDKDDKIDILALDSKYSPVVLLFQKSVNENIIIKGVFCLDWIIQHKAVFNELVLKKLPNYSVERINWANARLLCISSNFSRYDTYIISQINKNIELIRYRKYPDSLLLFESINNPGADESIESPEIRSHQISINRDSTELLQNEPKKRSKPVMPSPAICYCIIDNSKHYAVLPNKEVIEIMDIPPAIYLAHGQFILIDEYGCFKYAFPYKISDNELNQSINNFAVVSFKDSVAFVEKGDGILHKLNNVPANIQLRDKNIVSVDSQNNFIRFYKPVKHNADSFLMSAKAKGHQMVFVLKVLPDGALLRDIETGKEFFSYLDAGNIMFKENQVICICGNKVISVFSSYKFYTLSSYYDKFEYGTVEIKDGLAFLQKLTGEKVIIKDAPSNLCSGQVIYVDENNNFCGIEDSGEDIENDEVKKNIEKIKILKKASKNNKIEVTKQVLILGNKAYENSYKLCFLKYGYKAEVLEGFDPWAKINSLLKETDIVVVIISHVSHDNMWRIKKEIIDIPVIYSEFDGANRILEQVIAQDQEEKFTVSV